MNRTIVITHGSCPDGAAAAAAFLPAAFERYGTVSNLPICNVVIHPTNERDFRKDTKMPDLAGTDVFILDYSYPMDILKQIEAIARSLRVWDHHVTAVVTDPPPWYIIDVTRCAAEMAWDMIHGKRPWFIKHVRDRDLWEWKHEYSREFGAAFYADGLNAYTAIKYLNYSTIDRLNMMTRGAIINSSETAYTWQAFTRTENVIFKLGDVEYRAIVINTSLKCSDVPDLAYSRAAAGKGTMPDFVMTYSWHIERGEWWVSLRSSKNHEQTANVGEIAKKFGGGGHPTAAGFSFKGDLLAMMRPARPPSPARAAALLPSPALLPNPAAL